MFKNQSESPKFWILLLLGGVLISLLGIYALFRPGASLVGFAMVFSVMLFLSGLSEATFALMNRKLIHNWGWLFAYGLLSIFFGAFLMARPGVSTVILGFMIVFVIMYRSINAIGYSFDMKDSGIKSWWFAFLMGCLGVFISFYLVSFPIETGVVSMIWIGAGLLVAGVYTSVLAFALRK